MVEDPKPKPAPVDPLAPVPHVASKADVVVLVPRQIGGSYGMVEAGGVQVLHDVVPHPDAPEGVGVVSMHPDFVEKFLRAVEGSRLLKRPQLSAADEALEAMRPRGRGELPPLSDAERANAVAPLPPGPPAKPEAKAKAPAKK